MRLKISTLHNQVHNCTSCQNLEHSQFALKAHGNSKSKVMLISEAPGRESIEKGKMWSGVSGLKMRKVFPELEKCIYMTDLIKCLPPGNRKPKKEEILNCRAFLMEEIRIIKPEVILALGMTAVVHLFDLFEKPVERQARMRDYHMEKFRIRDLTLIPLYHPSWSNRYAPEYHDDLQKVLHFIERTGVCSGFGFSQPSL